MTISPQRPEVRVFPKGNVVISKRDLGVSHIPGSQWSWAPDGNEVGDVTVWDRDDGDRVSGIIGGCSQC